MTATTASMVATTLDKCDEVLAELHDRCCVPNRSPRMEALQESMRRVRAGLDSFEAEAATRDAMLQELVDAGGEIGRLQIECCAPGRMPLYSELLAGLSRTQRMITAAGGGMEH